jgi:hypothetical protein
VHSVLETLGTLYGTLSAIENYIMATYTECLVPSVTLRKVCTECFFFACTECFVHLVDSHILVVAIMMPIHQRSMTSRQPCWPQCWMSSVGLRCGRDMAVTPQNSEFGM